MRALIIQHDHVSPAGPVGERLAARGYELVFHEVVPQEQFHTPNVETEFPEAASCEVIVPMGAPWSTFDHARQRQQLHRLVQADGGRLGGMVRVAW